MSRAPERRYATPGSTPEPGEIWQPVGPKATLFALYTIPIDRAMPLLPRGIEPVRVWPGRTVGAVFLTYYGPGSTLEYHELIVSPAYVRHAGRTGWWVSHIYVDDEQSMAGGRALGLPKEMADFAWEGNGPGRVTVKLGGQELATLAWSAPGRQWRVPISSYGISIKHRAVLRSKQTLRAKWGRCDLSVSMPEESPFRALPLEKPLITLCGHEMSGEMCVDLKTIGWVRG